jgi:hypothetical protein
MGDGVAELLATRQTWAAQGTPAQYDRVHLVLGEGNFGLVVSDGRFQGKHVAYYDLYRVENDKIVLFSRL